MVLQMPIEIKTKSGWIRYTSRLGIGGTPSQEERENKVVIVFLL